MGTELVHRPTASIATSADPQGALDFAVKTSKILADTLKGANLIAPISGREHVMAEGWTLLAAMTNHTPRIAWCRKVDPDLGNGWEARCEVLDAEGNIVSAAEAMALYEEQDTASKRSWTANQFSMRSMAQTRATSKALKLRLGFIVALAGYETTPAEELTNGDDRRDEPAPAGRRGRKPKWETNLEANNRRIAALGFKSQAEVRDFATEHGLSLQAEDFGKDAEVKKWNEALDAREAETAKAKGTDPLDGNTSEQAEAALPGDGEQTTIDEERPVGAPAYGREPS